MTPDWVQAVAAIATFLAAGLAVWATFRAPRLAAEFSEQLRRDTQLEDEQRRLKMYVFTTLMQFRSQIANPQAVAALNLIDVVFLDSQEVRQAWGNFCLATEASPHSPDTIVERYRAIINCMARDIGLGGKISVSDIQNSYYPKGMAEMDEVAHLETQSKLSQLRPSTDLTQTSSTNRP